MPPCSLWLCLLPQSGISLCKQRIAKTQAKSQQHPSSSNTLPRMVKAPSGMKQQEHGNER